MPRSRRRTKWESQCQSYLVDGSVIEVKAEGRYTLPELLEAITNACKENGAPAFPRLLIDSRASRIRHTREDVQERLAAIDRWHGPKPARRVALLVSPGRDQELACFYSFYAQQRGIETKVFLQPDAARRWLAAASQPSQAA